MAAARARSAATRLLMLQLHSVSNGPSGEPAAPTAEFIIVCFQCSNFAVLRMDRVYNITYIYIYRVYVDSHILGQLALASKRIS